MQRILLLLLLTLMGYTQSALAQETYSLFGRVVDQVNEKPLMGATVRVIECGMGANARLDGTFLIRKIPDSQVTIQVTYLGYQLLEVKHDFSEEKSPNLSFALLPDDATTMDAVVIEAKAKGQVKAFLDQKNALNIKNVVSAEQIQSFPDVNAAEALQRIPGISLQRDQGEGRFVQLRGTPPELTNFNVNGEQIPSPEGEVRYVGLDIIAADQIEYIEVSKVPTPDMDGDAIGGSVNIITKTPEGEDPDIRATMAAGYNNLRGTDNYQLQFNYGQRHKGFGFNLNSSYYVNNQGSDNLEYKYVKGPFFGSQELGVENYQLHYQQYQLRHYDIKRSRIGVAPSFDYRFKDGSLIYLRAMYNRFSDEETRRRLVYDLEDPLSLTYYLYGGVERDVRFRTETQELATLNLGGEHDWGKLKLDYMLQYAYASNDIPDFMEVVFDNPGQAITIDIDLDEPQWPTIGFPRPADSVNAIAYDRYEMDEFIIAESRTTDENLAARFNLQFPYYLNESNKGFIQFGAKYRGKRKERDITGQNFAAYRQTSRSYPGEGPPLSVAAIQDDFLDNNLLNRGYVMDAMPSMDRMREFYNSYPQFFIFNRSETQALSQEADYTAAEDIYALYFMLKHDWNRLTVLTGLRFERTDTDYEGVLGTRSRGRFVSAVPNIDRRTREFLLPQVQLRYQLSSSTNLRAAVSYTYSRPNFDDVLPNRIQDQDEVSFGNPLLDYPTSLNVDLLAEKYLLGGILSGGVFYKKIDNFVYNFIRFAHEGAPQDFSLVEITKAVNGNTAEVLGVELQSQFNFNFLPGFLSNFGIFANYTFTHAEAEVNKRFPANFSDAVVVFGEDDLSLFSSTTETERIDLPGQAPHTTNLALTYTDKHLFARLVANYNDDFLVELGADSDLDEYYARAWRLDFTANYRFNQNFTTFIDLINLTNAPLRFYLNNPDQIKQQEYYSWWGRVGVKLNF